MIRAVLIFNQLGKPRLLKFYDTQSMDSSQHQAILQEVHSLVTQRSDNLCNYLEGCRSIGGSDARIIYRHYATLYFVFVVDASESDLGILDLIQVFVEALDRVFENVSELDIIFNYDQVHFILSEIVVAGMVVETNLNEISRAVKEARQVAKPASAVADNSAVSRLGFNALRRGFV